MNVLCFLLIVINFAASATPVQRMKELFALAEVPSLEEFPNASFAGRCIATGASHRIFGVMVSFRNFFDPVMGNFISLAVQLNADDQRFYKLSSSEALKLREDAFASEEQRYTELAEEEHEIQTRYESGTFITGVKSRLTEDVSLDADYQLLMQFRVKRTSQGSPVFVIRILCDNLKEGKCSGTNSFGYDSQWVERPQASGYCYADKKITP